MRAVAGKTVLITGAGMGLGKLFAHKAVGEHAAAVVLWDINAGALKDSAAELEGADGTVHTPRRRSPASWWRYSPRDLSGWASLAVGAPSRS